ncbi:MAG: helix-turn-helix domain-containing protein [Thermomicrobiales bacterium]
MRSPLGTISLAGFNRHSVGVPKRPMRVFGSFAIVYVVDGQAHYEDANGLTLLLEAGDLLVVFPELPHTYYPPESSHWSELYFVFDGPVFDLWRTTGLLDPHKPILHLEPVDLWLNHFESILGAPHRPGFAPSLVEVSRLQLVLSEALLAGTRGGKLDEETSWFSRACSLLESDVSQEVDLRDVAGDLHMSYDGFRKRFQRLANVPPAKYRGIRLIDRACELMQQGALNDRQIAEHLGFCDEFYFSRRFKQITGCSPRAWRQRLPRAR